MWPGQQAALRAFASARQWCVHGVSRILAMPSTSEIRLAGRQRVLAQSICSKSAFTECACAVVWMETLLPLLYGARGGADLASSPPTGFLTGSVLNKAAYSTVCARRPSLSGYTALSAFMRCSPSLPSPSPSVAPPPRASSSALPPPRRL